MLLSSIQILRVSALNTYLSWKWWTDSRSKSSEAGPVCPLPRNRRGHWHGIALHGTDFHCVPALCRLLLSCSPILKCPWIFWSNNSISVATRTNAAVLVGWIVRDNERDGAFSPKPTLELWHYLPKYAVNKQLANVKSRSVNAILRAWHSYRGGGLFER